MNDSKSCRILDVKDIFGSEFNCQYANDPDPASTPIAGPKKRRGCETKIEAYMEMKLYPVAWIWIGAHLNRRISLKPTFESSEPEV